MTSSGIGPTGASTRSALSSANAFSNRTRQTSVCDPKPTQPLQPGVAPCLATTLVVKYTRRCPDGPRSYCVTIVAFKFSALPFQGSPLTFCNSLITNLSSSGTRCNDLAFWTPFFRENNVFRLSLAPCQPRFHGPISDPDCLLARMCTCTSLFLRITWLVYAFQKHAQTQFSRRFLLEISFRHHAACRINHAIKMLSLGSLSRRRSSSDNHIARQTPLITRFAFSILL